MICKICGEVMDLVGFDDANRLILRCPKCKIEYVQRKKPEKLKIIIKPISHSELRKIAREKLHELLRDGYIVFDWKDGRILEELIELLKESNVSPENIEIEVLDKEGREKYTFKEIEVAVRKIGVDIFVRG